MIVLKPGQAEDWIAAARASGEPYVIIVGERVEAHSIDGAMVERVRAMVLSDGA